MAELLVGRVHHLSGLIAQLLDDRTRITRFLVTGVGCAVLNVAIFDLCHRGLGVDYRIGVVIAYALSYVASFVANRAWTFSAADGHVGHQGVRFFLVSAVATAAALVVTVLAVEGFEVRKTLAEAGSAVLAAPVAFVLHRRYTFAQAS